MIFKALYNVFLTTLLFLSQCIVTLLFGLGPFLVSFSVAAILGSFSVPTSIGVFCSIFSLFFMVVLYSYAASHEGFDWVEDFMNINHSDYWR